MKRKNLVIASIVVAPLLIRLGYCWNYPGTDDAFIYLAVVRNVLAGRGWGIVPGVSVNLTTSPLFPFLGLAIGQVTPFVLAGGIILSYTGMLAGLVLTYRLARRVTSDVALQVAVTTAAAASPNLWRWSGTFMETTLAWAAAIYLVLQFYVLLAKGAHRTLRDHLSLGAGVGIATLVRPELGLFGLFFFVHDLLNDRRRIVFRYAVSGLGLALVLTPYCVWAFHTFGSPLPTTFAAKRSGHFPAFALPVAKSLLAVVVTSAPAVIGLLLAGIGVGAAQKRLGTIGEALRRHAVLFLVPLGGFLFYLLTFEFIQSPARYLLPFTSTLPLWIVPAWSAIATSKNIRALGAAIAAQGAFALVLFRVLYAPVLQHMWSDYVATMSTVARDADRYCAPGDKLLVLWDVGVVSNKVRTCRIVDGGALGDPDLTGLTVEQMVSRRKPRFVLESLGDDEHYVEKLLSSHTLIPLSGHDFRSHGISSAGQRYTARLFELR